MLLRTGECINVRKMEYRLFQFCFLFLNNLLLCERMKEWRQVLSLFSEKQSVGSV